MGRASRKKWIKRFATWPLERLKKLKRFEKMAQRYPILALLNRGAHPNPSSSDNRHA